MTATVGPAPPGSLGGTVEIPWRAGTTSRSPRRLQASCGGGPHDGAMFPTPRIFGRRRRPDLAPLLAVPSLRDADPRLLATLAHHTDRLRLPPGRALVTGGHGARELIAVVAGEAARLSPGPTGVLRAGAEIGGAEV